MKDQNIKYQSEEVKNYYSRHRFKWDEFYESEKYIMDKSFRSSKNPFTILDVGCGCGGLGHAVLERYPVKYYKGIDINEQNITWAKDNNDMQIMHDFECIDITDVCTKTKYDFVVALGCMEVCVEIESMITKCWELTKRGGL